MPVEISWYEPGYVVLMRAIGHVTEPEISHIDRTMMEYIAQTQSNFIHMIIDDTEMLSMPGVKAMANLEWPKHPKYGWTVIVGLENKMYRFINLLIANLFKARQRMVDTMPEALAFLTEVDATLPPLTLNPVSHSVPTAPQ